MVRAPRPLSSFLRVVAVVHNNVVVIVGGLCDRGEGHGVRLQPVQHPDLLKRRQEGLVVAGVGRGGLALGLRRCRGGGGAALVGGGGGGGGGLALLGGGALEGGGVRVAVFLFEFVLLREVGVEVLDAAGEGVVGLADFGMRVEAVAADERGEWRRRGLEGCEGWSEGDGVVVHYYVDQGDGCAAVGHCLDGEEFR